MGSTLVAGSVNGAIYGLIALGIVLVYKGSRVLNFAQGEIGTFALFVTWWFVTQHDWPWLAGAAMGVGTGVFIGLLFERLVVRRMADASRLSVAVATIGLFLFLIAASAFAFSEALVVLPPPLKGLGPRIFDFYVSPTAMLGFATTAVLGLGLAAFLRRTDFGLGVLAAAQDPTMVRLVGVRISRVSAFTWGIAGAVGAIAALLIEPIVGAFGPGFMTQFYLRGLAAALLGGLTSLPGAFVGGIALGVTEALVVKATFSSTFPGISSVTVFVVIVAVLVLRPSGLLGARAR
ncbi:MAG TPA: branched-chain amino acid ABC transporter permease [Actinomycetota bacterium]|nr:branched-chain amino acid ABC transporter permease [Actinomycetota bacterium]